MTELDLLPEDWEVVRLGVIAEKFIGGGTPSTSNEEYWNGEIHWTTSKKINSIYLLDGEKKITKRGLEESSTHLIPKDNLVIGTRVLVGKVAINKVDIAISQDLTGAFIDKEKYALEFLAYQICTKEIQNIFKGRARGTTIKGIPRDDLKKISLKIPPLPEQHRIAAVLSAVQDAKEKTEAVIAAAKSLKKSLMRHLFTYGPVPAGAAESAVLAETEIGLVPEGWGVLPISQVSEVIMGQSPPGRSYNTNDVGVPLINGPAEFGESFPRSTKWTVSPTKTCISGDILFCVRGNTTGRMNLADTEYCIGRGVASIRGKDGFSETSYLFYFLKKEADAILALASAGGSTFPNITKSELRNLSIPLPPLPTQQKIASILSTADKKIEAEENKKKALDELFKSLLHSLMTGKIRVNHLEAIP